MSEKDMISWERLSTFVDWTRYHIENPSVQYCRGRVCGWRGDLAQIEWLLSPFVDVPEPDFALIHRRYLPSAVWHCQLGEEFEARIRPPRRDYGVWFKVRECSLEAARDAGVPEGVLAGLESIVGLRFETLNSFEVCMKRLIPSGAYDKYGDRILEDGVLCESDPLWYADSDCQWLEVTRMGIDSESSDTWLERLAHATE